MLDQYIQRLQNMEPFTIYSITDEGEVKPWYKVTGAIVTDLVLRDQDIGVQVQVIAAQIAHWARMTAQCKRVWEIEQRNYRVWRSRTWLGIMLPPAEGQDKLCWTQTAKGAPKGPTKEQGEALYRVNPEYIEWQTAIERAEEAYSSSQGILDAFKAKKDAMRAVVWRNRETGTPEMSV